MGQDRALPASQLVVVVFAQEPEHRTHGDRAAEDRLPVGHVGGELLREQGLADAAATEERDRRAAREPVSDDELAVGRRARFERREVGVAWRRDLGQALAALGVPAGGGGVNDLYLDGVRQTLARHPNTGYLRNDSGSGTHLTDSELTQADGFFVGARLRIRSINWVYDIRPVTAYTRGRLIWTTALSNNIGTDDWGYFLDGALALLDAPG